MRSADGGRRVDDDDRRAAGVGIDVDQPVEPHFQTAFLASLAQRRDRQRFAPIDIAAGEDPFPIAGLNRSADHHDAVAN